MEAAPCKILRLLWHSPTGQVLWFYCLIYFPISSCNGADNRCKFISFCPLMTQYQFYLYLNNWKENWLKISPFHWQYWKFSRLVLIQRSSWQFDQLLQWVKHNDTILCKSLLKIFYCILNEVLYKIILTKEFSRWWIIFILS